MEQLHFVNKSHVSDKIIDLSWDDDVLIEMLLKRAVLDEGIENYITNELGIDKTEILLQPNMIDAFQAEIKCYKTYMKHAYFYQTLLLQMRHRLKFRNYLEAV